MAVLCSLVLVRSDDRLLLARKRRGFGAGKLVAPGGKVEPGETPAQGALRELYEETGLVAALDDLVAAGEVRFVFDGPAEDFLVHLFTLTAYAGEPAATEELDEPCWAPLDALPLDEMWPDDAVWLPALLAGATIDLTITYDATASRILAVEGPGH